MSIINRQGASDFTSVSWAESRFARITGTTVRGVVTAQHGVSETVLKGIFGCQSAPTWQMELGSQYESQVLDLYFREKAKTRQKNRVGLVVHRELPYVGHTPDGMSTNPERVLQEVKVVFAQQLDKDDMDKLEAKHNDQIQLGMAVHNCGKCDLVVYKCPETQGLAEQHKLHKDNMAIRTIHKDDGWWGAFRVHAQSCYTAHLEWMYATEFSEAKASAFLHAHPRIARESPLLQSPQ